MNDVIVQARWRLRQVLKNGGSAAVRLMGMKDIIAFNLSLETNLLTAYL
jgi:hypothetical protein